MALVLDGNGTMTVGNGDITGLVAGALPSTVIGAGAVLQVVQSYTATSITTTSGSPVDTNLSASITPTSSSSKILVLLSTNGYVSRQSSVSFGDMYLYMIRGSTQIASTRNAVNFGVNTWTDTIFAQNGLVFLDSPATTSSTTYKLQVSVSNSQHLQVPFQGFATMTLMEIAA
jgi:hypothetical protein